MDSVNLHRDTLKQIDYPLDLPPDTSEIVKLSPTMLLLCIAVSLKRLADRGDVKVNMATPGKPTL